LVGPAALVVKLLGVVEHDHLAGMHPEMRPQVRQLLVRARARALVMGQQRQELAPGAAGRAFVPVAVPVVVLPGILPEGGGLLRARVADDEAEGVDASGRRLFVDVGEDALRGAGADEGDDAGVLPVADMLMQGVERGRQLLLGGQWRGCLVALGIAVPAAGEDAEPVGPFEVDAERLGELQQQVQVLVAVLPDVGLEPPVVGADPFGQVRGLAGGGVTSSQRIAPSFDSAGSGGDVWGSFIWFLVFAATVRSPKFPVTAGLSARGGPRPARAARNSFP
jgi:hypothetical protein